MAESGWGSFGFVLDSIIRRLKRKQGSVIRVDVWGEDPCRLEAVVLWNKA